MDKHIRSILLLAAFAIAAPAARADIPPAGWDHAIKLTVGGYSAERPQLSNFPVLVRVKEYDAGTSTGLRGFSYSDMNDRATGSDLCFFDASGTVPLAHEIDTWNDGGESLVWVKLPTMEYDTKFYICYGSSTPATSS